MEDKEKFTVIQDFVKKIVPATKKASGIAKLITLLVLIVVTIMGILGSFEFMKFNMNDYATFLDKFMWFFLPMIASIGANTAIGKIKKNGKDK